MEDVLDVVRSRDGICQSVCVVWIFWLSSTVSVWVRVFLYVVHCNVPWRSCQHVVSGLGESHSEWRMCKGGGCGRIGFDGEGLVK